MILAEQPARSFPVPDVLHELATIPPQATGPVPVPAAPVEALASTEMEDDDLQGIFLEEAREVTGQAMQAMERLAIDPEDMEQLTVLRRSFHTLKGSARMVGLGEFGEASWAIEKLLNSWLADQKTATHDFCALCSEVLASFDRWIADIAAGQDASWSAVPFCTSADALRNEGVYSALNLAGPGRRSRHDGFPRGGTCFRNAAPG